MFRRVTRFERLSVMAEDGDGYVTRWLQERADKGWEVKTMAQSSGAHGNTVFAFVFERAVDPDLSSDDT